MTRPGLALAAAVALLFVPPARSAEWQPAPAFPDTTVGRAYASGVSQGGTLYAIGGTPFTPGNDATVHYLPSGAGAWSEGAALNGPFLHQYAAIDALGRIVVLGGVRVGDLEPSGEVYVYDVANGPDTGLAAQSASAAPQRNAVTADAQGRIYVIGGGPGEDATVGAPNVAYAERYDAASDTWQPIAPLPAPVGDAAAATDAQGRVLVFGGVDESGATRLANVWSYDIATDTWSSAVPDLPIALAGHRAIRGADDRVYVLGGVSGPVGAGSFEDRVFVLDIAANTWSEGPAMLDARAWFGATLTDDAFIVAMGGENGAGGVWRTEKLYTPPCPSLEPLPASRTVWRDQDVAITGVATGGTPLTYQWRRNGVALADGPSVGGGTLSGTTTATLILAGAGPADAGTYDLVASNPCGDTPSTPTALEVLTPPALPPLWTVANLHPAGALASRANAVAGNVQGGSISYSDPTYGTLESPVRWAGTAASMQDVRPPGSVGGSILGVSAAVEVGWWWWPYNCQVGGQWTTCHSRQAALWQGTPGSHVNMQISGYEYSSIEDTDGVRHAGGASWEDASGNTYAIAILWSGFQPSYQSLHPAGVSKSGLTCLDGDRQYGWIHTPFPGPVVHAAGWSGSAASFTDLHPVGATSSSIAGAGDGQAVGSATFAGVPHAMMWTGDGTTRRDLHPGGATSSSAADAKGGLQVGAVGNRAAIWTGTAASHADLHAALPAEFSTSYATGVDVDSNGVIRVSGYGHNALTGRTEALLWSGAAPTAVAEPQLRAAGNVFSALRVAPTPGRGPAVLGFELARAGAITLHVFDVAGRTVRTVDAGRLAPGEHRLRWDGRDKGGAPVAAGVYFLQLRSEEARSKAQRLVRLR